MLRKARRNHLNYTIYFLLMRIMASLKDKFSGGKNSSPIGSPGGTALRDAHRINRKTKTNIGTWNVRGMLQAGKTHIIEKELQRCNIPIAGISETHWRGKGHFNTSMDNTIIFSGNENNSNHGVAFILSSGVSKSIMGYEAVNHRILTLKLYSSPVALNIIQVYAPTSVSPEDEIDEFYTVLERTIDKIPNREILIILGDFNAKIGSTKDDTHIRNIVGRYGIGQRNERGARLLNFCIDNNFTITNTVFQHHIRRLFTWQSPDGKYRNQIDYILIRTRFRTAIRNAKTLPSADCNSDHRLLLVKFQIKLQKPHKRILPKKLAIENENIFQEKLNIVIDGRQPINTNNQTVESIWLETKDIITNTVKETPRSNSSQKRQHWMSDETLKMVNERRVLRNNGLNSHEAKSKYSVISKQIQRLCRRDKNTYLQNICKEAQQHAEHNNTRGLFQTVKQINRRFSPRTWAIVKETGETVTESNDILETWRKYCENLFQDGNSGDRTEQSEATNEPSILKAEVELAIRRLKTNKAPGCDGISAEVIKAMGVRGVGIFHGLCQKIWSTKTWPEDWVTSIFMPLHKKGAKTVCDNYRLISLISHASKIMLSIIHERLKSYLEWQIPPEQAGFVRGRGTREQILNLRQIIEKCREFKKPLYLCFVDYRKAFDSIKWNRLWTILKEMGVPDHLSLLIQNLYVNSKAAVKIDNQLSNTCKIGKGVRQGCILSPILFNIYGEYIMRGVMDGWRGGIAVGGVKISNLRYADDTVLLASTQDELLEILHELEMESNDLGLDINYSKTKVMIIDRAQNNRPDIQQLGQCQVVNHYIYLGALISNEGGCSQEINRRCEIARRTAKSLQKTWRDSAITLNTKKTIIKTLIFPVLLYGAETWSIKAVDRRKIDAFELWCWRRVLRIPWTAKRTNLSIIQEVKEPQRLSKLVQGRILRYFGHLQRRDVDNLERLIVQGQVEGTRSRGRSPIRWTDQIRASTDLTVNQAASSTYNREKWREMVRRITTMLPN